MDKGSAEEKVKALRRKGLRARKAMTKTGWAVYQDGVRSGAAKHSKSRHTKRKGRKKGRKSKGHSGRGKLTPKRIRKATTKAINACEDGGKVSKACVIKQLEKYL